jgi:hypothetical protein
MSVLTTPNLAAFVDNVPGVHYRDCSTRRWGGSPSVSARRSLFRCRWNDTGRASMQISIRVDAENIETGQRRHTYNSYSRDGCRRCRREFPASPTLEPANENRPPTVRRGHKAFRALWTTSTTRQSSRLTRFALLSVRDREAQIA